jgi:hypothetical protein
MPSLIIDDRTPHCLDPALHRTMHHAGSVRVTHLTEPLPEAPIQAIGATLPIVACQFHPSYQHFTYSGMLPPMVDLTGCLVCHTAMVPLLAVADRLGALYLTLGLCPRCGFIQHMRRPPRAFYGRL